MNNEEEAAARSDAGRQLGSIRTPRKSASSARNAALATAAKRETAAPCNCGRTDGSHHHRCPIYRQQAAAKYRKKQKEGLEKGGDQAPS